MHDAFVLLVVAGALGACGHRPDANIRLHHGDISLHDGELAIEGTSGPQAHVSASGQLTIGSETVAVSDAQRAELVRYYNAAAGVMTHAVATGVAGAKAGAAAVSAVTEGLANGDMSGVKSKVRSQADEVQRQALKICDDLTAIRAAQDALVRGLTAFQPYAVVAERDVADCAKELHAPAQS